MDNDTQFQPSPQNEHQNEVTPEDTPRENIQWPTVQEIEAFAAEAKRFEQESERSHKKIQFNEDLEYMAVDTAIEQWLNSANLSTETRKQYERYVQDMKDNEIIPILKSGDRRYTLGELRRLDQQANIDKMNQRQDWSESTKQLRISCYLSLMKYLSNMSGGWFRSPRRVEYSAYYEAQHARIEKALTLVEWQQFIRVLHAIDHRDSLIARCLLRNSTLESVLNLRLSQVNFDDCTITFHKANGRTVVTRYPASFMQELKQYVVATALHRSDSDLVFVTRGGKKVVRSRLNYSFVKAGERAQIKRVTPYALRATYIMLAKGAVVDENMLLCLAEKDIE